MRHVPRGRVVLHVTWPQPIAIRRDGKSRRLRHHSRHHSKFGLWQRTPRLHRHARRRAEMRRPSTPCSIGFRIYGSIRTKLRPRSSGCMNEGPTRSMSSGTDAPEVSERDIQQAKEGSEE